MPEIEPPAGVSCSRCGSTYLELSHSRTLYDHDTKRNVKLAQWYCPWCHSYTPSKWLRSWDLEDESSHTSEDFVLESGRYKGQHLSDVADDPRGLRYLDKISEKDSKVRTFLDGLTKLDSSR